MQLGATPVRQLLASSVVAAVFAPMVIFGNAKSAAPTVYFLEFEANTFVPVYEGNLSQYYNMSSLFESRHIELRAILERRRPGGKFDNTAARLSVKYVDQTAVVVDKKGVVQVGSQSYTLDAPAF